MSKAIGKGESISDMRILIVEDQSDARSLLRTMLMGLKRFTKYTPTNVRQLRSVDPNFPFLMVTARADQSSVLEAKSSGVTGYISKPFSASQLEAKLRVIRTKTVNA